jgi:hypothetical protein
MPPPGMSSTSDDVPGRGSACGTGLHVRSANFLTHDTFVVCGVRDAWNCSGVYLEGVEQVAPAEKRTRSKYDREYQVQGDEL